MNYEKLIMELLQGGTPKEKYEYLQAIISKLEIAKEALSNVKKLPEVPEL